MVGATPTIGTHFFGYRLASDFESWCAVYDFSFFLYIYITVLLKAALRPRSLFCCVKGGEANGKIKV